MQKIEQDIKVGIWDTTRTLRIYKRRKRAVLTNPRVKWVGSTGTLDKAKYTLTGDNYVTLLAILAGTAHYEGFVGNAGALHFAADKANW